MEGLNNMVKTARSQGWIKGFEVAKNGNNSLEVTHLQYADDTLIFCDAKEEQLRFLRIILVLFEGISGLHINWRKSHLFPVNEVPEMEHLALILGGEVGSLPTIYLGMPLGAKSKSKLIWNSVIEKCEKKLARWKSQYLSLGGRLTLINSVLDSLPTYMMSLFPIPAGVTQRLDRLRRSFLWQGNKEKRVVHLVKWKSLTIGKAHGGLGIRNLKNQNKALKMKWLWRYSQEIETLWSKVIKAKYGEEDKWVSKVVNTAYGVSLWKSIRSLWPVMKSHSSIRVNNGNKTSFWKDNWLGVGCLKELFPDIYGLVQHQHRTIAEVWTPQGWDLIFRRMLNDWEVDRLTKFYKQLEDFKGLQSGVDTLWWQGHNKGSLFYLAASKGGCLDPRQSQKERDSTVFKVLSMRGNSRDNQPSISSLHCTTTDQLWKIFINLRAGMKLEVEQETEIDGGLSQHVFGGQSGKKGILDVLRTGATQYRRSS
ncbi:PREDICTED: uncharacterized protein LOC109244948 [Nicotiana attenuata]|uniref:uncharacterized protein LOC109244948 n=1 Tax=Nicotiana attenuata TaxID=49451 RepID=UPI000905B637|nr:PREDICTED: uncharacterized protein LOC109244948 [Nicotiana attenuata]